MTNRLLAAMLGVIFFALNVMPSQAQTQPHTRCNLKDIEKFLSQRQFELPAEQKIDLYADKIVRYYDQRDATNAEIYRTMRQHEQRWPERVYKYIRTTDFEKTEEGDACKVVFDYRFVAYSPRRDRIRAGIGTTTLVLADLDGEGHYQIIGEFGKVNCRGLRRFARSRC